MFDVRTYFLILVSVLWCVCGNGFEPARSVELYPPWKITYRYLNEEYRVSCRCYETYSEIKWIRLSDGTVISEKGNKTYIHYIQGGVVLVFANITKEAEGDYECLAYDKSRNKKYRNQFFLNVAEPIVFSGPTVYEAVLDENVFLGCEVNEKFALKRYWEFEGNVLPSDERFRFESEGIEIPEVGLSDAGKYYCVISHWPFQSNSNRLEITLIVYYKPVARFYSKTVYGFVDETVSVSCEVNSNPNPWFIWYDKYREPVDPKQDNVSISFENDTSILQVLLTTYMTETHFICEACNQLGCTEQTIYVKTTTKLRTPVLGLWDVDSDSAEFYVSTQDEALLYIFEYYFDVDEDAKWEKPFTKNFSTALLRAKLDSYMKYVVDELHPDTKYILRVASANQYTISEFSEERRFKTRVGRTIHTICNDCTNLKSSYVVLLLPFVNVILFINLFY